MNGDELDRRRWPDGAIRAWWEAPDGLKLRKMDWPQLRPEAARGSLLFAGGRADFLEKYLEAYDHWHRRGWNVTSFDWRGQGLSRAPLSGPPVPFDLLVDDLAALVAAWKAATPGPHVAVAHSMGGHLLLRALAEREVEVAAAVLVAPMIEINSAPVPPRLARLVARGLCRLGRGASPLWRTGPDDRAGARRREYLTGSLLHYEDELWWKRETPGVELGPPDWAWLRTAYRSCDALWKSALEAMTTPILLLGTRTDRLVDSNAIDRVGARLPDAETFIYPDAGHELLRDRDDVRFDALARIDRFFDAKAP